MPDHIRPFRPLIGLNFIPNETSSHRWTLSAHVWVCVCARVYIRVCVCEKEKDRDLIVLMSSRYYLE